MVSDKVVFRIYFFNAYRLDGQAIPNSIRRISYENKLAEVMKICREDNLKLISFIDSEISTTLTYLKGE